jgi:hypothetical protein
MARKVITQGDPNDIPARAIDANFEELYASKSSATSEVWLNGSMPGAYVEDGSIGSPYKTLSALVTAKASVTTPTAIHIAPGTYTESGDLTLPNAPIVIYGNGATLVNTGHTITIPNPNFVRWNLFTTSNIVYQNYAEGARCVVFGGSITGNLTVESYVEVSQCQLNGGTVTVQGSGQLLVQSCSPTSHFVQTGGKLMFQNININTAYAGYLVLSTGGQLIINGSLVYNNNTGAGGSVSCDNGATTLANLIANNVLYSAGTGYGLYAGTAAVIYSKNYVLATNTIIGSAIAGVNTDIIGAGTIMALGSDAIGDMYYRNSSGLLTRLPKGTAGQTLKMNAGATAPTWV